jgi:hypothetical protein
MPDDFCCQPHDPGYTYDIWRQRADIKTMIKVNNSYENYTASGERSPGQDRLTLGSALLAIFGLSLFGWAVVLAPFVAIFHK